jgi:hypothetical protein
MRDVACLNESQLCTEYLSLSIKQNLNKRVTGKMRRRLEDKEGPDRIWSTGVRRFTITGERKFKLRATALPRYAETEPQRLRFINDARNLKRNYELAF